MSRELFIGVIGGVLTTILLYIVAQVTNKVILPAIRSYLYRGANISGRWNSYDSGDNSASRVGFAEIEQSGEKVKVILCRLKSRSGREIKRKFEYHGQFCSGQLTLLFEDVNMKDYVTGAIVLKLSSDNMTFSGKTVYFDDALNTVVAHDFWLRRDISGNA